MIALAVRNLTSSTEWNVENGILVWRDTEQTRPTDAEINAEVARLQAEHERTEYQRQRAAEYPPIGDQLDALWKGGDAATEMLALVQAVKSKHPKPE